MGPYACPTRRAPGRPTRCPSSNPSRPKHSGSVHTELSIIQIPDSLPHFHPFKQCVLPVPSPRQLPGPPDFTADFGPSFGASLGHPLKNPPLVSKYGLDVFPQHAVLSCHYLYHTTLLSLPVGASTKTCKQGPRLFGSGRNTIPGL